MPKRYFGEIIMPFRAMAVKALEKLKGFPLEIIAPSHGPIYRDTARILEAYWKWSRGETESKVIVVYVTMWGSTWKMVSTITETLLSEGLNVELYNLASADLGEIAKDLVDSKALVLDAPTVLGGAHPLAVSAAYLVRALRPPLEFGAILSSYGWGGGALRQIQEILSPLKIEIVGAVEAHGPPTEDNLAEVVELGKALAKKVREVK
jgi:flavorubredoxin